MKEPKVGDKIRVVWEFYYGTHVEEYTLEKFRYCLGFFANDNARESGGFTTLADPELYREGPDSEHKYIPNYGDYVSNQVPTYEIISSGES